LENPNMFIIDDVELVVAPEPSFLFCQWVFAAPKNSPVLKSVIDLMVYRILHPQDRISPEEYGRNYVYYFTGPMVFTDGIQARLNYATKDREPYKKPMRYSNSSILHIFEKNNFHKNKVKHLYYGSHKGGWKTT